MILIIMGHGIIYTPLYEVIAKNTVVYIGVRVLQIVCAVATNLYVMLSGYFLCESSFSLKRVLLLWLRVLFYSVVGLLVINVAMGNMCSLVQMLQAVLPVSGNQYWFMRVYLGLYLLSPFVNILIRNLKEKQHQLLMVILIVMFSLWRSFIPFATTLNPEGGNSIIWFVVLYIFGAYIRKRETTVLDRLSKLQLMGGVVFNLAFAFLSSLAIELFLSDLLGFGGKGTSLFTEFTAFTMLFGAFFIILLTCKFKQCENVRFKQIVLTLASSSLSVYLIHENIYVRPILWKIFDVSKVANNFVVLLIIPLVAVVIYFLCTIIDKFTWSWIENFLKKMIRLKCLQKICDKIMS